MTGPASMSAGALGHELYGAGRLGVVILNDWLCDTSTWDGARGYLDTAQLTWAFADLRGYGRSRGRSGAFTVEEGAADVLALADALGWRELAIIGHSMSTLIALHLAQHHTDRITKAVVIAPPPPSGLGADDTRIEATRALALGDEGTRAAYLLARVAGRLSPGWAAFKAARWWATSDPAAAAAYVAMFSRDGLPDRTTRITVPVLAITGEQDFEPMRSAGVTQALAPLCERLEVVPFADCGHYPMQEMPPLLVAHVERFLLGATLRDDDRPGP